MYFQKIFRIIASLVVCLASALCQTASSKMAIPTNELYAGFFSNLDVISKDLEQKQLKDKRIGQAFETHYRQSLALSASDFRSLLKLASSVRQSIDALQAELATYRDNQTGSVPAAKAADIYARRQNVIELARKTTTVALSPLGATMVETYVTQQYLKGRTAQ